MKKVLSVFLASLFIAFCAMPFSAYATDAESVSEDVVIDMDYFNSLPHVYAVYNEPQTRTTGLISTFSLGISKDGSYLLIAGTTYCINEVVKCGFTVVTVEYRSNSSSSWNVYVEYEGLYADSYAYNLGKRVYVTANRQYRVTATHYAKKNIFQTQKIDAETTFLQF